jgi:hypothetical protein
LKCGGTMDGNKVRWDIHNNNKEKRIIRNTLIYIFSNLCNIR